MHQSASIRQSISARDTNLAGDRTGKSRSKREPRKVGNRASIDGDGSSSRISSISPRWLRRTNACAIPVALEGFACRTSSRRRCAAHSRLTTSSALSLSPADASGSLPRCTHARPQRVRSRSIASRSQCPSRARRSAPAGRRCRWSLARGPWRGLRLAFRSETAPARERRSLRRLEARSPMPWSVRPEPR